jgi:hypothetical protein
MRLRVVKIEPGMHPSEQLVTISTSSGNEQLIVDKNLLDFNNNSLLVSHPLAEQKNTKLIELPRETMRGFWRVWVEESNLQNGVPA